MFKLILQNPQMTEITFRLVSPNLCKACFIYLFYELSKSLGSVDFLMVAQQNPLPPPKYVMMDFPRRH